MGRTLSTLITSATSGVGLHLAEAFAAEGNRLVLLAADPRELERVAAQLRSTYGVDVDVIAADLGQAMAVDHVLAALDGYSIDVLVNSFGQSRLGVFWEVPLEHHLTTLRVSIEAVIHLTVRLLPKMVERNRGGLLNLACFGRSDSGAMMAVHHACKSFMCSWSQALASELANTEVRVMTVCREDAVSHRQAATPNLCVIPCGERLTPREMAMIGYRAFAGRERSTLEGMVDESARCADPDQWCPFSIGTGEQGERGEEGEQVFDAAEPLASQR